MDTCYICGKMAAGSLNMTINAASGTPSVFKPVCQDHMGRSSSEVSEPVIRITFPLRENTNAELVLPKDLTLAEVKRLGAFMLTLATDEPPKDTEP